MKTKLLPVILLLCCALNGTIVTIGQGTTLHQGLPIEPVARYSYSQQLFFANEIGCFGLVSSIGFKYNVNSNLFYEGNKLWKIWLGHTNQSNISSWISVDSLTLAFDGTLPLSAFQAGLPGSGWLIVQLDQPFYYNGSENLIVAVDENSSDYGSTSDDFFCTSMGQQVAIQYQNASINPDPANPPSSGYSLKTYRSNLQLDIEAQYWIPVSPLPAEGATNVAIDTNFAWNSICSSFSLHLGTHPDSLNLIAENIFLTYWQSEFPLQYNRLYYWRVIGYHEENQYPSPIWSFHTCTQYISPPQNLTGSYNGSAVALAWNAPETGVAHYFKVYRNSAFLNNSQTLNFTDPNVQQGLTYFYYVTAVNLSGSESGASNLISVSIPNTQPQVILFQGFESCNAFETIIPGWQNLDLDASPTSFWVTELSYPNQGSAMGWMCFNPQQTIPPLTSHPAYHGNQMLASICSIPPPNNDWLISPALHLGSDSRVEFKARSAFSSFGLERLGVYISTTNTDPASFVPLHEGAYLAVPVDWTSYQYDLSSYDNARIHLAWRCMSVDAMALFMDNIAVISKDGWVGVQDEVIHPCQISNFPNPSHGRFALSNKEGQPFTLEIYNLKGQKLYQAEKLHSFDSASLPIRLISGVYLLKIKQNGKTQTLKQIIIN